MEHPDQNVTYRVEFDQQDLSKLENEEENDKDYKIATPYVRNIHIVTGREVVTARN